MSEQQDKDEQIGWGILELMGHRRLGGFVAIEQKGGVGFFRIDVPATDHHPAFTQWYHPNSLYCLSPVSEDVARSIAERAPEPATRWEIQAIEAHGRNGDDDDDPSDRVFSGEDPDDDNGPPWG